MVDKEYSKKEKREDLVDVIGCLWLVLFGVCIALLFGWLKS